MTPSPLHPGDHAEPTTPRRLAPETRPLTLLRGALVVLALVVVVQAALGFAGVLGAAPAAVVGALALLLPVTAGLAHRHRRRVPRSQAAGPSPARAEPWTGPDAALAAALVAAFGERTWSGLHRTTFLYDVLSYHLHLPAAWRAAGRLTIVPTPFGDPAPAYSPANAELVYHLGLAAAGNATLAHAGQIPFAALAVLAIYTTARVLGTARVTGFAAALAFLLIPEVWQQTPTAMADLAMASLFLAAIPFLLRLGRRRSWSDLLGLGLALGLLVGTKFAALVAALPLLPWAGVVLLRPAPQIQEQVRRAPALAFVASLVLMAGGFWYVRNAIATGNPFYPATVSMGATTLARGLYDGALIRTSEYHVPVANVKALLEILVEPGWGFLGGMVLAAGIARRTLWPALALTIAVLDWFVIPYQQSRFFFSLWGVGSILLVAATLRAPRLGAAALAAATLGSIVEFPTPARLALVVAAALGPRLIRAATPVARRRPVRSLVAVGVLAGLIAAATVVWARTRADGPAYGVGDHHDQAWAWLRTHPPAPIRGRDIAYTGSNLPLPLWGPRFENVVHYVNISGGPGATAHDFPHGAPAGTAAPTAEPAPERQSPDQRTWLSNLDALHVELLFVATLYPSVQGSMTHDQDGFPIERSWADGRPDRFSLLFANDGVRIYGYQPGAAR